MSQARAAAPAPPLEIVLPRLAESCIPRILCNILRKDATFQKIEFRCQQFADVRDIAESQHNIPLSVNTVTREFECPPGHVKSALEHELDPLGHRGKHTALEQDREQQILEWIKQNAEGNTPVTRKEIKDSGTGQFNFKFQSLAAGKIRSFFSIQTKSFNQQVPAEKSSVVKYSECFSNERCRISMNMFRAVQLN
jgi:hypothetical protein